MRGYILLCLVAAATADISGYSYGRQSGGGGSGGIGSIGGISGISGFNGFNGFNGFTGGSSGGGIIGGSLLSGSIQPHIQHHVQQHVQQQIVQHVPQVVQELNKEFYTFSAPEEEFHDPQIEQQVSSIAKKNLQVVFIHAPEQQAVNRAVQNLAQQTLEQQTAIYVLTKQADLSHLANTIQRESNNVAHKPEVHFIKYRTHEDAARAQQSIRAQYDSLGGSSRHSDEGVAPVLNFASQAAYVQPASIGGSSGSIGSSIGSAGSIGSVGSVGSGIPSIGGISGTQILSPSQNYLPIRV